MSKNNTLEKGFNELMQERNSMTALINNTWKGEDQDDEKITAKLEFKLSILLKLISSKIEYYDEQRLKIMKEHVHTDEQGNFKFKSDSDDEVDEEDEEKPVVKGDDKKEETKELDWKDEDSKEKVEKEIQDVLEEKVSFTLPVKIKTSDFINKKGETIELHGHAFFLSDYIELDE